MAITKITDDRSGVSFIALQSVSDAVMTRLRNSGDKEAADVIYALRQFAYAQWDANHRAMGALRGAPAMETER